MDKIFPKQTIIFLGGKNTLPGRFSQVVTCDFLRWKKIVKHMIVVIIAKNPNKIV